MKAIPNIFLILLVFFQACSPQKRLARLIKHHPELTVADTLKLRDTVISPLVTSDTMFNLQQMTDTMFIEKERLSVKLFRQRDTLYVEGKCKPDTIIREVRIPVEKVKIVKGNPKADFLGKLLWALAAVIVITILFKIRKC